MAQKKLLRFSQLKTFPNTLEHAENMPGQWPAFFGNENPVILELACGRGEYTLGLARLHPAQNYIGIDLKGNRMYIGAKKAIDEGLKNVGFLRTQIEKIAEYFAPAEVSEIWITFPDPQLRTSKAKKRLTHPRFLRAYQKILKPGGLVHLKTDSPALYHFTLFLIERYGIDLHAASTNARAEMPTPELAIRTHYENLDIAQSNKIFYLCFSLNTVIPNDDAKLYEYLRETEQHEA